MKTEIEWWLRHFPEMTKDEVEYIAHVLKLPAEKKDTFFIAKRIFEEELEFEEEDES